MPQFNGSAISVTRNREGESAGIHLNPATKAFGLLVITSLVAACTTGQTGEGETAESVTPYPTWDHCSEITPRPPVVVSAAEATQALSNLATSQAKNQVDLSCVATKAPLVAATGTPTPIPFGTQRTPLTGR